ncbi:M23 family metallopeptidase [Paenibacillus sp. GCM10027628]|uniref:M23 family metallopeptidase n=1 Tax=Paenibacillus sp. GCM10027628 TaxID=3273413 RepID=UPI003642B047
MKKISKTILSLALTVSCIGVFSSNVINAESSSSTNIISPMGDPDNPYFPLNWDWPTTNTNVTQLYGGSEPHKGIDIGVKLQSVTAVESGVVMGSGQYTLVSGYTSAIKYVTIKHDQKDPNGNNLIARYLHLDSFSVNTGNTVSKGQQIGISGNTGAKKTGTNTPDNYHLHFDVNNGNTMTPTFSQTINPKLFWPYFVSGFQTFSLEPDNHEVDELSNPDYFIDQLLINYVGQDAFEKWMADISVTDHSLTNFKKKFHLKDEKVADLLKV